MVAAVMKRILFAGAMLILVGCASFADLVTTVDLTDYLALLRLDGASIGVIDFFRGYLDFIAAGNDNVKGELELEGDGSNDPTFSVKRAYIKVRFPAFRMAIGKTRVSWGDGFFFNAGDVIFGSLSLTSSLLENVLRDTTDFMAEAYVPFDKFSFLEALVLPNPVWKPTGPLPVEVSHMSYGGRIVGRLFDTKLEAGYLYNGNDATNHPYVSFQGNLALDWNLSASCSIPIDAPDFENWETTIAITTGLFYMTTLPDSGSISFRLESAIRPYGAWAESTSTYGIYFYPEISYAQSDTLSYLLRALISPVDGSGVVFGGAYWNIYQGFTIGFLTSVMFGDENDTFGWGKPGDLSFIISVRYIYGSENKDEQG
jgi:hypothetical protein